MSDGWTNLKISKYFKSGVYIIRNDVCNRYYIGQARCIYHRIAEHFKNNQSNKALQQDFERFGKQSFSFKVLETVKKEKLNERESYWISDFKNKGFKLYNGYGTLWEMFITPEVKERIVIWDKENTMTQARLILSRVSNETVDEIVNIKRQEQIKQLGEIYFDHLIKSIKVKNLDYFLNNYKLS